MHYRKIWEAHYNKNIPEGFEIHHVDGNRSNNCIENLLCVSVEEHLEIHKKQNDHGAVLAILARMNDDIRQKEQISEIASSFQKKLIENGTHNFQKIDKEKRSLISKKSIEKRKQEHDGKAFLNIANTVQNSSYAGKMAAEKCAGFLDTKSDKHGSKHVKGSFWWYNIITGERKRSKNAPNNMWKKGMNNGSK